MTALFEVLKAVAALIGTGLFVVIMFIGATYIYRIYSQDRKKYLEEELQRCKPHLDLEATVEYVKICTDMGYRREEIISQLYLLTQERNGNE